MNSFRRDPCAVCGRFLIEHYGKPSDARCAFHQDWKRPDVPPPAPPMRDGRGREVPLRGYGKEHCVMCHKPNDNIVGPGPWKPFCKQCSYQNTNPPPTVEYRQVGSHSHPGALFYFLYGAFAMGAGFLLSLAIRGCI